MELKYLITGEKFDNITCDKNIYQQENNEGTLKKL